MQAYPADELTAEQVAAIDHYVSAEIGRQQIPGAAVGIYRRGRILLAKGYGLANVELNVPVKAETIFQSGSVGKQFVSAGVMMLVEQGKISLDDSITKYFPNSPPSWERIRVKNLLSHTSGLAEYETPERSGPKGPFYLRLDFTEDELVEKIQKLPIEFAPGESWDYRNTNYVLLGVMIHQLTGKAYADYLHDTIFAPLGMTSTRLISEADIIPNRASGYELRHGKLKNQEWVSPTFNSTADGTLYFNVLDLAKWDGALYGTKLLTQASLDRSWTVFLLNNGKPNPSKYGFGWAIAAENDHRVIEHGGAWQGFTCDISRYADDGLTVVVLTNLDSGHARPARIGHVVAGLVEPALMPKKKVAIADTNPELTAKMRAFLDALAAGRDVTDQLAPALREGLTPEVSAELRERINAAWPAERVELVVRVEQDGLVTSQYRIVKGSESRMVAFGLDANGKLATFDLASDPDIR